MPVVLVYGGAGGLGSVLIQKFKEGGFETISVDLRENPNAAHSVVITGDGTAADSKKITEMVKASGKSVDALLCVAGGFNMSNIKDESIFSAADRMLSFNVKSSISAGYVAAHTLKEGGLLVLTGAHGALSKTPHFLAYGMSKAATHHLVSSLSAPDAGLPKDTTVTCILPITLDTPQNRTDMPNANFDNWTPLADVAHLLLDWSNGKGRPKNGDFIEVKTVNKHTTFTPLDYKH